MARNKDYYEILGISSSADEAGVRNAYRDLAMRHHPDRAGAGSTHTFQEIAEAYGVLGDQQRRAAYDRNRGAPAPPASAHSTDFDVRAEPFDARPGPFRPGRGRVGASILDELIAVERMWRLCVSDFDRVFLRGPSGDRFGAQVRSGDVPSSADIDLRGSAVCLSCLGSAPPGHCPECGGVVR
ncbi:hypothetical protein BH24PSE2_BH24PSE2_01560 [soil metagenome]